MISGEIDVNIREPENLRGRKRKEIKVKNDLELKVEELLEKI